MTKLVQANESVNARRRVYFQLYVGVPNTTPALAEAGGQPQASINGGPWDSTLIGTLIAIGDGRYYADLTLASVANAGDQIVTRYANSGNTVGETPGDDYQVVGYNPADPLDNGLGAWTATITVQDSLGNPLQNATVRLTLGNQTEAALTNDLGVVVLNINSGTWTVAITCLGYSFGGTTIVVGSGDVSATYHMTAVVITPSSPPQTTGYVTCYDEFGNVQESVTVTAIISQVDGADVGHAYDSTPNIQTSDINGLVQFVLFKGKTYYFQRGMSAKQYQETIPLTAGSTYALPSIIGAP